MTAISCHEFGYRRGRVLRLRFPRDWQLNWIHSSTFGALWPKKIFARRPSICADISCFFLWFPSWTPSNFPPYATNFFFLSRNVKFLFLPTISFSSFSFLLFRPGRLASADWLTRCQQNFFFSCCQKKILNSSINIRSNFQFRAFSCRPFGVSVPHGVLFAWRRGVIRC